MDVSFQPDQVELIPFAGVHLAVLEHHGSPALIENSIQRFITWRKKWHLHPHHHATFNIFYNNPDTVAPENFHVDLGGDRVDKVLPEGEGIVHKTIPAVRCAWLRYIWTDHHLGQAIGWLYQHWLPQSGEAAGTFPLFCQRVSFYPDAEIGREITDIYLPLL